MAEPLKKHFGPIIPRKIAAMIAAVYPRFAVEAFMRDALKGYQRLELMPRGRHIARTLRRHLPDDYCRALEVLIASLDVRHQGVEHAAMANFLYLPHVFFVAEYGLDDFEASMRAQYILTQRFTAEFSIRPFLIHHPEKTLARLQEWAADPNEHVRRLVSEGTRPRLPWAPRLRAFQEDPRPVLDLLELLKDDESLYVRRSVANNLNDIGKDHPALLADTARRWLQDATPQRQWLVRHGLRSAVKRGETAAFELLGFTKPVKLLIRNVGISPERVRIGGKVNVRFEIVNAAARPQAVLVDYRVHYVKAAGKISPKTFKLKSIELAPQQSLSLGKTLSLADLTTRKHYPGIHRVEVLLNGQPVTLGSFHVIKAAGA